ncbi:LAMI_0C05050g1_1 [Lachancea mirantina]|uniref:LAMI_0C05050g1_1 n=1 Tax=Lachancea mirantina TaxID=1230905 RepID=A0A1G4J2M7_9SACH|nr:LAMI_0C05050g1_1 [Lachancea mirantina]
MSEDNEKFHWRRAGKDAEVDLERIRKPHAPKPGSSLQNGAPLAVGGHRPQISEEELARRAERQRDRE